ncbi:glycosyltransferase family 4 protein [Cohnella sp. JJ-181]|uniref:glycosyltransferase family 4 protein n=1 Tax=Cohnella rhizoplanae TaxID=2974897 RepID=UPI0022FFBA4C|nr:glycosyltransferase family 1 protein [Cohnella sp. JJ-181]CAI6076936.1 D-inositol-3-phosphate glycosyltransferase [Cohnella sp. JJ-181]
MKLQKIYINGRFLTHPITGVQRYAIEILRSLDAMVGSRDAAVEGYEFTVLAPQGELKPAGLRHIETRQGGRGTGHAWEQLSLPSLSADGFLLSLCNTGPMTKRRQAVTMHDAAVYAAPDTYSFAFRTWYKVLQRVLGANAKQILTCSAFSRAQLTEHFGIPERKIKTIYHGREHILRIKPDETVFERHGLTRPYVLAVSSMSPNKNFASVAKAIELMDDADFDIVIAGGSSKIFKPSGGRIGGEVKQLGYVTDEELRALYDRASCFVFPSFYEGFGFPALEAMACGCPVVASDAASIPEVCRDAVLYCDPRDPADIADKIERIMASGELRAQLRERGLARAAFFSWDKCARETLDAIRPHLSATAPAYVRETERGLSR